MKGFSGAAEDNGYGTSAARSGCGLGGTKDAEKAERDGEEPEDCGHFGAREVGAAEECFARGARDGGQAERKKVLAVERDAEVAYDCQN